MSNLFRDDFCRTQVTGANETETRRLIQRIEAELQTSGIPNMIGVFGLNSDTVVDEALRNVRVPYEFLGKVYSGNWDVYTLLGSRILEYMTNHMIDLYNREGYSVAENVKVNMLFKVGELPKRDSSYQEDSFDTLHDLNIMQNRDKTVEELLKDMKKYLLHGSNKKFVFCIEVDMGDFNYELLQSLHRINSPDLLIIINTIRSRSIETSSLGSGVGLLQQDNIKLFHRYFTFTNVFSCD